MPFQKDEALGLLFRYADQRACQVRFTGFGDVDGLLAAFENGRIDFGNLIFTSLARFFFGIDIGHGHARACMDVAFQQVTIRPEPRTSLMSKHQDPDVFLELSEHLQGLRGQ